MPPSREHRPPHTRPPPLLACHAHVAVRGRRSTFVLALKLGQARRHVASFLRTPPCTLCLPEDLSQIGEKAFAHCASLRAVRLADAARISWAAFEGCSGPGAARLLQLEQCCEPPEPSQSTSQTWRTSACLAAPSPPREALHRGVRNGALRWLALRIAAGRACTKQSKRLHMYRTQSPHPQHPAQPPAGVHVGVRRASSVTGAGQCPRRDAPLEGLGVATSTCTPGHQGRAPSCVRMRTATQGQGTKPPPAWFGARGHGRSVRRACWLWVWPLCWM